MARVASGRGPRSARRTSGPDAPTLTRTGGPNRTLDFVSARGSWRDRGDVRPGAGRRDLGRGRRDRQRRDLRGGDRGGAGHCVGRGAHRRSSRHAPAPLHRASAPLLHPRASRLARPARGRGPRRRSRDGTAASPLDGRPVVWSLTRFRRRRPPLEHAFFHEVGFDFLLDDGTDEPIWIEVSGGMLIRSISPRPAGAVPKHDPARHRPPRADRPALAGSSRAGGRDRRGAGRRDRGGRASVASAGSQRAVRVGTRTAAAPLVAVGHARAGDGPPRVRAGHGPGSRPASRPPGWSRRESGRAAGKEVLRRARLRTRNGSSDDRVILLASRVR